MPDPHISDILQLLVTLSTIICCRSIFVTAAVAFFGFLYCKSIAAWITILCTFFISAATVRAALAALHLRKHRLNRLLRVVIHWRIVLLIILWLNILRRNILIVHDPVLHHFSSLFRLSLWLGNISRYYKDNTQNQYSYEHEKTIFEICALLVP